MPRPRDFLCQFFFCWAISQSPIALANSNTCIQTATSVTAVLFDVSDPLNEPASLAFDSLITRLVDEVEEGGRIDVYFLKDGVAVTGNPQGHFCKPLRPLAGGDASFKKRLQVQFVGPAMTTLKTGKEISSPSISSPILESIFNIGLKSFSKTTTNKKYWGKIVVISDLLQNSSLASFYSSIPTYEKISSTSKFTAWSRRIDKVGLELVMISNNKHAALQGRDLLKFWGNYGADNFCAVRISPISRSMKGWTVDECR